MATYRVQGPDGRIYRIEGPDDATEADVLAFAEAQYKAQASAPTEVEPLPSGGPRNRGGRRRRPAETGPSVFDNPNAGFPDRAQPPKLFQRDPELSSGGDFDRIASIAEQQQAGRSVPQPAAGPVSREFRGAVEHAYERGDAAARQSLTDRGDRIGVYAREVDQRYQQADQQPQPFDTGAQTPTERMDPRVERRAQRLMEDGLAPDAARGLAQSAADLGLLPGAEVTGEMSATDFDFDRARRWETTPGLNNPIARGAAQGLEMFFSGLSGTLGALPGVSVDPEKVRAREQSLREIGTGADDFSRNMQGAVASITQQLPFMGAGAVSGGVRTTLAGIATVVFGQEYGHGVEQGLSHERATARAATMAGFEIVGESFGLGRLLGRMRDAAKGIGDPDELTRFFASQLAREIPGEMLTTTGQFLADKHPGFGLNPEAGLQEYLSAAKDTVMQTVMQGGIMTAGIGAVASAQDTGARRRANISVRDAMEKWDAFGASITPAAPAAPQGTNFTPPDSLVAEAGITPIVVPGAAQTAPTPAAVPGHPAPLAKDEDLLQRVAATAPPAAAGAPTDHNTDTAAPAAASAPAAPAPAQTWFGRRGDGYLTEGDAQQALPGRQRMFRDLEWRIEPTEAGKYRLAGYPRGQTQTANPPAQREPARDTAPAAAGTEQNPGASTTEGWEKLPEHTGTLGVPRAEMPQIRAEHRGAMVNFLGARGIAATHEEVAADSLKATQAEYSPAKVDQAHAYEGGQRSILVSSDGHVLDGHHQWLAAKEKGEPVKIIRLGAPIRDLIKVVGDMPSAELSQESEGEKLPADDGRVSGIAISGGEGGQVGVGAVAGAGRSADPGRPGAVVDLPLPAPGADRARTPAEIRLAVQRGLDKYYGRREVQIAPPTKEQDAQVQALSAALGEGWGGHIVAVNVPGFANGITIGRNAAVNVAGNDLGVAHTTLHENHHIIEQIAALHDHRGLKGTAAQRYRDSMNALFDDMTDAGKRAYVTNFLHEKDIEALPEAEREGAIAEFMRSDNLRSEMVADFLGARATDRKWLQSLAEADPTGFTKFVQRWLAAIDNIMESLRGVRRGQGLESEKVDSYLRDLERAKIVAREALVAYRRDRGVEKALAEQAEPTSLAESGKQKPEIREHSTWRNGLYRERSVEVGDGRVRWIETDDTAYVTDIGSGGDMRGRALLDWLATETGKELYAVGVVEDAQGFWDKMEDEGVITGQTDEDFMSYFMLGSGPQKSAKQERDTDVDRLGFYSELSRKIEAGPNAAMPEQWRGYIRGLTQKGVKPEEIEASGVMEWLDAQTGKVPKDAVLEHLDLNGVQVEEVVNRADADVRVRRNPAGTWDVLDGGVVIGADYPTEASAMETLDEYRIAANKTDTPSHVKYASYVVPPGGTNYREILLTLPIRSGTTKYKVSTGGAMSIDATFDTREEAQTEYERRVSEHPGHFHSVRKFTPRGSAFQSSHWDQPNVLAHIRVDDRVDSEGNHVLFVNEIQSDWAQEGRKKGFRGTEGVAHQVVINGVPAGAYEKRDDAEAAVKRARKHQSSDARIEIRQITGKVQDVKGVVPGPFVGKTESWVALALRRVVDIAAREGYDKVALVTGKQAADMFDLSKRIKAIDYEVAGDGLFEVIAIDHKDEQVWHRDEATPEEIEEHLGKEIAQKIVAGEGKDKSSAYRSWRQLTGVDLEVGGKGMKTFYDVLVPGVLKRVLKGVGAAPTLVSVSSKVAPGNAGETPAGNVTHILYVDGKEWNRYSDKLVAELDLVEQEAAGRSVRLEDVRVDKAVQQPGFDVTPEMRERVLAGGQPQFSLKQTDTPEFKRWFGDSKVVDENGEPLVVYHGTPGAAFNEFDKSRKGTTSFIGIPVETKRHGFFFAENREFAKTFAEQGDRPAGSGAVMPVYLSVQKPLMVVDGQLYWKDISALVEQGVDRNYLENHFGDVRKTWEAFDEENGEWFVDKLRRAGFDGVLMQEEGHGLADDAPPQDVWVVFEPTQIKSAIGNTGAFDPANPDIRFSKKQEPLRVKDVTPAVRQLARNLTPAERKKLTDATAKKIFEQLSRLPDHKEMAAVAVGGKAKRGWYRESARAILAVFEQDAPRFAALLAAMSPQTSVENNLINALNTWKNWVAAGRPQDRDAIIDVMGASVQGNKGRDSVLDAWVNNSVRALTAEDPTGQLLSGPKVNSFFRNLIGDVQEVTNDAWMANYALVDQTMFSGSLNVLGTDPGKGTGYLAMNALVRRAADYLTKTTGETWTPAEVQETVWSWAKTLYELQVEGKKAPELLKEGALTDELINSTPDFSTLFHEPAYRKILEDAGYGRQLNALAAARGDSGKAPVADTGPQGEAGTPAAEARFRLQLRAARRLAELKRRRDAEDAGDDARTGARGRQIPPLPGAPAVRGFHGPDPRLVEVAERYARANGITLRRQARYVNADSERGARIAAAYEAMEHAPQDPRVAEAYANLIKQTVAQYKALAKAGYKFWFIDTNNADNMKYAETPWNAMRDIRANKVMGVFPTDSGFGTKEDFDPSKNPLLAETEFEWPVGSLKGPKKRVLANDLFRAVHDAFGHGLEGAGFRADGEENAWQAHVRLFTGSAIGAITSETRGQNSWLNFGPYGEKNRTAKTEDTVFADQKTGLMPEWTWAEGRVEDAPQFSARQTDTPAFKAWFGDSKVVDGSGEPLRVYHGTKADFTAFVPRSWFAASPHLANQFIGGGRTAKASAGADGGRVIPAYLSITNPLDIGYAIGSTVTARELLRHSGREVDVDGIANPDTYKPAWQHLDSDAFVRKLESLGFDGVSAMEGESKTWLTFRPEQIKSAIGNDGTFDPTNPDIAFSARQTEAPEFKRWFGGSKVVNADGTPKTVYHGTTREVTQFSASSSSPGIWFTDNKTNANEWAGAGNVIGYKGGEEPAFNIIPAHLSLQNPFVFNGNGKYWDKLDLINIDDSAVRQRVREIANSQRGLGEPGGRFHTDHLVEAIKDFPAYDGVIFRSIVDGKRGDVYVAMRSDQVRSAISGVQFSARQQAPANTSPAAARFLVPGETSADQFRRKVQDAQFRLRVVQEAVRAQGGVINEDTDTYAAWELMPGRVQGIVDAFDQSLVTPFLDELAKQKVSPDEIALYAYAMHAPERNRDIRARNPQGIVLGGGFDQRIVDAGSGMTDADAKKILAQVKKEGRQKQFDAAYQAMRKMIDANRLAMYQYGLITQAEFNAINAKFRNWVPLRGLEHIDHEQDEFTPRRGRGLDIRGAETMPAMGRISRASGILENILTDFYQTTTRGERNIVNRVLLDMVLQNPDPSLWEVDPLTHVREVNKTSGFIEEHTKPETRTDVIALKVAGQPVYIRIKDPLLRRALLEEHRPNLNNVFMRAMMGVNTLLRNTLTRYNPPFAVANAARDAQQAATYIIGELGSKAGARFAKTYPKALAAAGRAEFGLSGKAVKAAGVNLFGDPVMDKHYEEFLESGAITGGFYMKEVEDITRDISRRLVQTGGPRSIRGVRDAFAYLGHSRLIAGVATPMQLARLVEAAGSISENATRFALYHAARSTGATKVVAARIAKNGTTNFNRKGEWGPMMNTLYLFSGAAIQGARSGLHSLVKSKHRGKVAALASTWAGLGLAMSILGAAVGGDNDNGEAYWDLISEEEKRRNWIIMLPPGEALFDGAVRVGNRGRYIKIPMPYLWNLFPVMGMGLGDAMRNAGDSKRGVSPARALASAVGTLIDNTNPIGGAFDVTDRDELLLGVMPTIVDIPLQFTLEVNAFGMPVSPSYQALKVPDHESVTAGQAGGWGHQTARWLYNVTDPLAKRIGSGEFFDGRGISMKPGTIENSFYTLTGGTGRFFGDILSTAMHLTSDQNTLTPNSVPFLNKIYGEVGERQEASRAYDRANKAKVYSDQMQRELGLDYTPRSKYEEAMLAVAGAAEDFQSRMSEIRKQQILVMSDATMPRTRRVAEANDLRLAMDEVARGFNAAYLEIMSEFEDAE